MTVVQSWRNSDDKKDKVCQSAKEKHKLAQQMGPKETPSVYLFLFKELYLGASTSTSERNSCNSREWSIIQ